MKLKTEMVAGEPVLFAKIGEHPGTKKVLHHDAAAAHALLQAIEGEPEFPGEMPDEMWEALRNDRDAMTFAFGASVRATKDEIKRRASELMAEWGFGE